MEIKAPALRLVEEKAEPPPTLTFYIVYSLAVTSAFMLLLTQVTITLPIRVGQILPDGKGQALGLILGAGAIFALVANPLAGMLSDRTDSRFGRRRPWIVVGYVVATVALAIIAWTDNLYVILLGWCVAQAGGNASLAALMAIIPDQIPESHRGRVSSIVGMGSSVGVLVGAYLVMLVGTSDMAMFIIPTLVGLAAILLYVYFVPDAQINVANSRRMSVGIFFSALWVNPLRYKDFGWAWLSRFMVFYGVATTLSYQVYLLYDRTKISSDSISKAMFISSLLSVIFVTLSASIGSWFSDRYHRRKIFVFFACLIHAAGLFILISDVSLMAYYIGTSVLSIGLGCYLAVDNALVVDVLPNRERDAAKNLGIMNIANAVPQSLAPSIAPVFLALGSAQEPNYVLLFCVAALVAAFGAILILPVKGTS